MVLKYSFKTFILGLLLSLVACQAKVNNPFKVENFTINKQYDSQRDSSLLEMINTYKKPLEKEINQIIGYSKEVMEAKKPESLLTNYVVDLYYEFGKNFCKKNKLKIHIDGAIMNVRGLRADMPKGEITAGKIYEVMPFENQLFIVKLRGKYLKRLLNHIARVGGEGVSNMQLEIKENRKLGKCLVNGKPINKNKLYHIVTIDYLINGGSGMSILQKNEGLIDMNILCRDAIIRHLKNETRHNRKITAKLDKRIYYENQ